MSLRVKSSLIVTLSAALILLAGAAGSRGTLTASANARGQS
jgi:hypothetical protein